VIRPQAIQNNDTYPHRTPPSIKKGSASGFFDIMGLIIPEGNDVEFRFSAIDAVGNESVIIYKYPEKP